MRPVPAKPSATIVVLRNGSSGLELLLVKRRAGDAFGENFTFPGGVVDDDEAASHNYSQGRSRDEANTILSVSEGGLDYYSAAIRELFEETGILLARNSAGDWCQDCADLNMLRKRVDLGELPWWQFLKQQELLMASDALHYFDYWETPLSLRKRWSTRFFLAESPPGQEASHDGSELTDSRWISASDALALQREGGMKLPMPTENTLESLSGFDAVEEVVDWAQAKLTQGIERILPKF